MISRELSAAAVILTLCGCADVRVAGPSHGALVIFEVQRESFRVWLSSDSQIAAARAAQAGGAANIPVGRIVAGTQFNSGWSWHLEDVVFAGPESALIVCDGRPSDVEAAGPAFGGGRFCPWTAAIITID